MLYPLDIIVVNTEGAWLTVSLVTVTLAQDTELLPRFGITKLKAGNVPEIEMLLPRHCTVPVPPLATKELLVLLSLNNAHSAPVSAAKKALPVSLSEVPKFISFNEILATPRAIASS